MKSKIIPLLLIFIVTAPTSTFAHGGHKEKNKPTSQTEETGVLNDSIYAINSTKNTEPSIIDDDPLSLSLSNSNVLSGKDSLMGLEMDDGEPMIRFEEKIPHKQKHSQHDKQKHNIEKATHKLISPGAKGYRVAVGITIISGLTFAGLSFFRIGEGSAKDPS